MVSSITMLHMARLGLHTPLEGAKKNLSFLSITFLDGKVCERDLAIKTFEYGNGFHATECRKNCSCAPTFNFVSAPLDGATTEC